MLESLTAVRFSTIRFYVLILCPPDRLQIEDLIIDLNCRSRDITYKRCDTAPLEKKQASSSMGPDT